MVARFAGARLAVLLMCSAILVSCGPMGAAPASQATKVPTAAATASPTVAPTAAPSPTALPPTPLPTSTAVPTAPAPTVAPSATAAPPATAGVAQSLSVTLADDGKTIALHPGDRFLLNLGDSYDWSVTVADPAVVSRVVNVLVVRGAQGIYEAGKPGATTLTATGDPPCRKAQPACGAPSRLFRVQITVL
ncbi:MAG TPA: hypothetical protein VF960_08290 [Chloroflexota bacterium]